MGLKAARQRASDLTAAIAKAKKDRAGIGESALAEKRGLTDAERESFLQAGKAIEKLEAEAADNAIVLASLEASNEAERHMRPVGPDPDQQASAAAAKAAGLGQVIVGQNNADADPKRGFKDYREFLADVMSAGQTRRVSAKLRPLQATQGSDEAGVYSDPAGGFLVPHGVAPGLLSTSAEADFIAPLVTDISPMQAPTVSFNARVDKDHTTSVSGGFTVTRRPETVDGTASRMTFEQVTLTANEEFGLAFATERILTDSPQSFVALINAGFNDEYANNAINERLNGSGVGERLGILHANNGCLVSVAKETGQAANTIVKENIDKMAARSWRYSQACWCANPSTRPQLRSLHQAIGTGGSLVSYFASNPGGQETLDGRPIYFTEHAKNLGTVGDLILCVWSQYLEGTYQQLQSAESIHVRFAAAERAFRFYRRNDGRPWWRTAMTPKNSAPTLSPFVALNTRA